MLQNSSLEASWGYFAGWGLKCLNYTLKMMRRSKALLLHIVFVRQVHEYGSNKQDNPTNAHVNGHEAIANHVRAPLRRTPLKLEKLCEGVMRYSFTLFCTPLKL